MAYLCQRWVSSPSIVRFIVTCGALVAAPFAWAQPLPPPGSPGATPAPTADSPDVESPQEIDISDLVLAAAKQVVSVQESPSIITVVTREQILQRGYRTLWDVLQAIPGFEASRYSFTYRYTDAATRGNFNTILMLWNGISVTGPHDAEVSMDRRLPLDAIERIEVTSGPGGVLWGANAFLGVVNVITRDGLTMRGVEAQAGYGAGPGERNAFKASATAGERFFNGKLRLFLNVSFYTFDWAHVDFRADGLVPPLNAPAPDGAFSYRPSILPVSTPRSYTFAGTGNIGYGPFQLDFHIPWDRMYRPMTNQQVREDDPRWWDPAANGGAGAAVQTPRTCDATGRCYSLKYPTLGFVNFHLLSLRYQDQFLNKRIGVTARGYYTGFFDNSATQGYLAPSIFRAPYLGADYFITSQPFTIGGRSTSYFTDIYRGGGTVDVTVQLPFRNRAIVGAEAFQEGQRAKYQLVCNGDTSMACAAHNQDSSYQYVQPDGSIRYGHGIVEYPGHRLVVGVFAHDEWRPIPRLALSAGIRYQYLHFDVDYSVPSIIYADTKQATLDAERGDHRSSSQGVLLGSAAGTVNLWKKTNFKVNFAQGFRPPRLFQLDALPNAGVTGYPGNPLLDVEKSYAIEGELNTVLLERRHGIRRLYLRTDYSFSRISNLIIYPTMTPENAGQRSANSVEFAANLEGLNGWNLWLNYYFLDLVDAQTGPVRNVARQKVNLGGALKLWHDRLELTTVLSLIGPTDDLNREFVMDAAHASSSFEGAYVTTPAMLRIDHFGWVPMWRVGAWLRGVVPKVDFSLFVDNVLNVRYSIADAEWNARQAPMPIPMPGLSFMLSAWVKI
jgi:outer membrane receptor protein involved in Fe transport